MSLLQLPHEAEIVERIEESPCIYTLRLRFQEHQMPLLNQSLTAHPTEHRSVEKEQFLI